MAAQFALDSFIVPEVTYFLKLNRSVILVSIVSISWYVIQEISYFTFRKSVFKNLVKKISYERIKIKHKRF